MARRSSITTKDLERMLCDQTAEPQALPLSLLEEITDGFCDDNRIGSGGFAVVYKGTLENRIVAVKSLSNAYMHEKEFIREVECLMMVKHKNVVRFIGYCADTQGSMSRHEGKFVMADVQQRLLCFEYLSKGSLHKYINDISSELQWRHRYEIINGICHGLHYLHQNNIVHLDLKPGNVLLDDDFVAKIAAFGLSRCFNDLQSRIITMNIGGTFGYLAPEFYNGEITYQFDIYSLGVIIIEILTGKKGYQAVDKVIASWCHILKKSQSETQLKQVRLCAEIGIECINPNPAKRPDTQNIINRLNEYIEPEVVTSQQAEDAPNELHQGVPNMIGETSSQSQVVENGRNLSVKLQIEVQQEQVRVDKIETTDGSIKIGMNTSLQLVLKDLVFTVKNEPGYELKQLRYLTSFRGRLEISGLENVTGMEEALEANLAAKEQLTELNLEWDNNDRTFSDQVQADILEGLCPLVGLKKLKIVGYEGSRYPEWMVGKHNGGPKDLEELDILTHVEGPTPQIVESFPHVRVLDLSGGTLDPLPRHIEHLTSLKKLRIGINKNIRSLLYFCDRQFTKSCLTVGHPNWQKIEHVPKIFFDELTVLDRTLVKLRNIWSGMTM